MQLNRPNYAHFVMKHVAKCSLSTNPKKNPKKTYCDIIYHDSDKILSYCPPHGGKSMQKGFGIKNVNTSQLAALVQL